MDSIKTRAIVIKAINYKEYDKLITIFSLEFGKMTVVAKGVMKEKAKLKYATIPFCYGEFMLTQKGERYILTSCEQIDSFYAIMKSYDVFKYASIALKTLDELMGEVEYSQFLIEALTFLTVIGQEGVNEQAVTIKYLLNTLRMIGYMPDFKMCSCSQMKGKMYFDMDLGLCCQECKGIESQLIAPKQLRLINDINDNPYSNVANINNSATDSVYIMLFEYYRKVKEIC